MNIPNNHALRIMKESCQRPGMYAGPDVHAYTSFLYGVWVGGGGDPDEFDALMKRCIATIQGPGAKPLPSSIGAQLCQVTWHIDEAARVILAELRDLEPTVKVVME